MNGMDNVYHILKLTTVIPILKRKQIHMTIGHTHLYN